MSQIANLNHDLQNCLREINAAREVLSAVSPSEKEVDLTRHWFDVTQASLRDELTRAQAKQSLLAATLQPGCDYFTLIRSVRALRQSIEETHDNVEDFANRVQFTKHETVAIEPALPPPL